jgi:glycolate oxidase iron-sulfur subunit
MGFKELAAMLELAPKRALRQRRATRPRATTRKGERPRRVILLAGCAQQVLRPEINEATVALLARRGVDVEIPRRAGCCGALVQHLGQEATSLDMAKRNIDAWSQVMDEAPVDAIIINTSGCGTVVKDYGHMLRRTPDYAERAERISALTKDISEFLTGFDLGPPKRWSSLRVANHAACSLQHGQQVTEEPKALLRKAGFTVLDVPEGHLCCGSAGTYNMLQPELAEQLRDRKVTNIQSVRPDVIAAGNIGCIAQIASGTDIPIVHTVELLDWAYGGSVPRGLEALAKHVSEVPEPKPAYAV